MLNEEHMLSLPMRLSRMAATASVSVLTSTQRTNSHLLYQLKITLMEQSRSDQGLWRRVIVPANFSLLQLHVLIQDVFAWKGYHLHQFTKGRPLMSWRRSHDSEEEESKPVEYSSIIGVERDNFLTEVGQNNGVFIEHSHVHSGALMPPLTAGDPVAFLIGPTQVREERAYRLHHVFSDRNPKLNYEYDFGAGWEHSIEFEGVVTPEEGFKYPACVDGRGAPRSEDRNDEDAFGRLLPKNRRKQFNVEQVQRVLAKTYAENTEIRKCYMCKWYGGCGGESRCNGSCCEYCLKSSCILSIVPFSDREANAKFEDGVAQLRRHRQVFLESGACNYEEPNGRACLVCSRS